MVQSYFKCTKDGFFPDKTDCWVYHICDGGTHSVRACEEDLFFNPKTGLCDWPMNVDCKQVNTKYVPKITSTKLINTQNNPNNLMTFANLGIPDPLTSVFITDSICSSEDYGYLPHPKDCKKYIYCQEGQAKIFTCQGGLLWKQTDANCVWPLDSDCPSLKKPTTASNSQNGLMSGGYNSLMPNSAQSIAALKELYGSIECPIDVTGFFPNPYDCTAYHFCNGGKDQVILCEPGLYYRQDKQVCDWQQNSKCVAKCPSNKEKYRFADPKSCCRYYECINGRLVIQLCQYPLLFDPYSKQCLDYSKVKCGIRKDCTSPCNYFANEDPSLCDMVPNCMNKPQGIYLDQNRPNCQYFFTCRDNRVFNHSRCPNNLRFNQFEGRCMQPNLIICSSKINKSNYYLNLILVSLLILKKIKSS